MSTPLSVVCAIILKEDGTFLACQRGEDQSMAGKWEFPGGKIEHSESATDALVREIEEELGITISPEKKLTSVLHTYSEFTIHLIPYVCTVITTSEIILQEHQAIQWVNTEESTALDWADADLPILAELTTILKN